MSTHKGAADLNELKIAIPTDRPWCARTVLRVRARLGWPLGARHRGRHSHVMQGAKGRPREADNSIWLASTMPAFVAKTNALHRRWPDVSPVIEGTHRAAPAMRSSRSESEPDKGTCLLDRRYTLLDQAPMWYPQDRWSG
jgi:hypothetical protein